MILFSSCVIISQTKVAGTQTGLFASRNILHWYANFLYFVCRHVFFPLYTLYDDGFLNVSMQMFVLLVILASPVVVRVFTDGMSQSRNSFPLLQASSLEARRNIVNQRQRFLIIEYSCPF